MVANLPYDLTEDKVRAWFEARARLGVVSSVV
jgi:hypothetical protein